MIRSALFASLMVAHSAVVVLWGQAWTITKSCLLFPAISGKHMIACYYCNSTILCVCKHTAHDWRQVWPSYWGTGRKGTSITHEHGHGAATASNPLKSALSNRFSNCPFRNHALIEARWFADPGAFQIDSRVQFECQSCSSFFWVPLLH